MRLLPDWQLRFEAFIKERQNTPFQWGANDCATFASDYVLAVTGEDPAPPELRTHQDARQALRAVFDHGGLESIATAALGSPVGPQYASVGDVVMVRVGKRTALGVCNGSTVVGPSSRGLAAMPMSSALKAWRVS